MRYWLGLGSNVGQRACNLAEAIVRLTARHARLERISPVYETAPVGVTDQPHFLNMAICVDHRAGPQEMMQICLQIEQQMGRVRRQRWGPRNIDIDILCYDGPPIRSDQLEIPHPRMAERQFVLRPLADIAPWLSLLDGRLVGEVAEATPKGVRRLGPLASVVRREIWGR